MPVEDTHFVVHHSIDSFIEQVHGEEMPGGIDHKPSINEARLILNADR